MKRSEFTKKLGQFLTILSFHGYKVVLGDVHRSDEEQKRLFDLGLSNCDGKKNRSNHQDGKAADIWALNENGVEENHEPYKKMHIIWSDLGGGPVVKWMNENGVFVYDWGHFE